MGDIGPAGPGGDNPFDKMGGFLGDLARMLQSAGPVSWDTARQWAAQVAGGGEFESNPDPVERIRLEELARVADLRVADLTGLATSVTGRGVTVLPVTKAEFARRTLDAWQPVLERLSTSLAPSPGTQPPQAQGPEAGMGGDPSADMLGPLFNMIAPLMFGMQAGSMVGHVAGRSLGQHDLPLPRPASDELVVVAANLTAFAEEWSLPPDDVRLWVCLSEVATHAVLGVPHVRDRLQALVLDYVGAFSPDPSALEERMAGIDISDPASLPEAFGDPSVLLGAIQSPAQRELLGPIGAILAVVVGYVDDVLDRIGATLIGSYPMLSEAARRRRVEAGAPDRFIEHLLGLELEQTTYERGTAFVTGVRERAGDEAVARLWHSARELPTPAEVDAPGLWLARIDLPS